VTDGSVQQSEPPPFPANERGSDTTHIAYAACARRGRRPEVLRGGPKRDALRGLGARSLYALQARLRLLGTMLSLDLDHRRRFRLLRGQQQRLCIRRAAGLADPDGACRATKRARPLIPSQTR